MISNYPYSEKHPYLLALKKLAMALCILSNHRYKHLMMAQNITNVMGAQEISQHKPSLLETDYHQLAYEATS